MILIIAYKTSAVTLPVFRNSVFKKIPCGDRPTLMLSYSPETGSITATVSANRSAIHNFPSGATPMSSGPPGSVYVRRSINVFGSNAASEPPRRLETYKVAPSSVKNKLCAPTPVSTCRNTSPETGSTSTRPFEPIRHTSTLPFSHSTPAGVGPMRLLHRCFIATRSNDTSVSLPCIELKLHRESGEKSKWLGIEPGEKRFTSASVCPS